MTKTTATLITLLFILVQCNKKPSFIKLEVKEGETSSSSFSDYCHSFEAGSDPDYTYNRFGQVKMAIDYHENYRIRSRLNVGNPISSDQILIFEQQLKNPDLSDQEKKLIELMLATTNGENNAEKIFLNSELIKASVFITDQAQNYHFLLLNEAHYSSQQRAFTASLLKGLWSKGYRYLAIEALAYNEFNLNKRGYPTAKSGYYIQDPIFGNMVRTAIELGYTLVPYEFSPTNNNKDRERIQAKNIYERTYKKDKTGKVVVHAGYSHISKANNGTNSLMGYYLNEFANGKVLSVDQETMSYKGRNQNNDYYDFAIENFDIEEASLFVRDNEVVIDPVHRFGIDIQVYHPKIEFIKGRPMWLYNSNKTSIPLPEKIKEFKGMLIRAQFANEEENSVPIDQFVIDTEKQLILPSGDFIITIVDCDDEIISKYSITN